MECGSPDTIEYIHHDGAARDAHRPAEGKSRLAVC